MLYDKKDVIAKTFIIYIVTIEFIRIRRTCYAKLILRYLPCMTGYSHVCF